MNPHTDNILAAVLQDHAELLPQAASGDANAAAKLAQFVSDKVAADSGWSGVSISAALRRLRVFILLVKVEAVYFHQLSATLSIEGRTQLLSILDEAVHD